jgi:hypothetical protein
MLVVGLAKFSNFSGLTAGSHAFNKTYFRLLVYPQRFNNNQCNQQLLHVPTTSATRSLRVQLQQEPLQYLHNWADFQYNVDGGTPKFGNFSGLTAGSQCLYNKTLFQITR